MATVTHKPSKKPDPGKSTTEILPPKAALGHKPTKKSKPRDDCCA